MMQLSSFEYMDDYEVSISEGETFTLNIQSQLIEIRMNNELRELVPIHVVRRMTPIKAPPPPRLCNRCRRYTSTSPCHHCEGRK